VFYRRKVPVTEINDFITATKLGTTNNFFLAATKNFAAATKRFVDRTKHFVVVTKYFCYPFFLQMILLYNKTFFFRARCDRGSTCNLSLDAFTLENDGLLSLTYRQLQKLSISTKIKFALFCRYSMESDLISNLP